MIKIKGMSQKHNDLLATYFKVEKNSWIISQNVIQAKGSK